MGHIRTYSQRACFLGLILSSQAIWSLMAEAQPRLPFPGFDEELEESQSIVVGAPRDRKNALEEAEAQFKNQATIPALNLIQFILDQPEDFFLDSSLKK